MDKNQKLIIWILIVNIVMIFIFPMISYLIGIGSDICSGIIMSCISISIFVFCQKFDGELNYWKKHEEKIRKFKSTLNEEELACFNAAVAIHRITKR